MPVTEMTISMIQPKVKLPLVSREDHSTMERLSRKEILKVIDDSEKDIAHGRVCSWETVREEARERYGF